MHQPVVSAPLPVLRAAVFAAVSTVLGVSAHHLLVDSPVPWWQGGAAAAALFAFGLAGNRRPRSMTGGLAASGAAQGGLHAWLTLTAHAHTPAGVARAMPPGAGDAHAAWHERLHDSTAMAVVHLGAAVLVAVLLHQADAAGCSLARGLSTAVRMVQVRIASLWDSWAGLPVTGHRPPVPTRERMERRPPESAVLWDVVVRRGPPHAGSVLIT